ncbi:MAG: PEP-CTERM sorting domain-containing protein [Verrucomicrobia bacterium]|nr:PEP-CTERM sorting domain-containing protein [Verrucomicrobiota bacterium]MCH8513172.1 PEP-CTERM sorting domain-containing protein [Kiritimatiellia bacterium]
MKTKTPLVLFAAVSWLATFSHATLIASDGFLTPGNYNDTSDIHTQNPTLAGFDGAWVQGGSFFNRIRPSSTGISGFFHNEQAGGLVENAAGNTSRLYTRDLSESSSNPLITTGEYWAAHLMRVSDLSSAGARAGYTILGGDQDGPLRTYGIVQGAFSVSTVGNPDLSNISQTVNLAPQADTDYIFLSQVAFTSTGPGVAETFNIWALTRDQFEDWDQSVGSLDTASSWHWTDTNNSIIFNEGDPIRLASANIEYLSSSAGSGRFQVDELRYATSLEGLALIPEPSTLVLLGVALGTLLVIRRRS